jgi:hypothetical protein
VPREALFSSQGFHHRRYLPVVRRQIPPVNKDTALAQLNHPSGKKNPNLKPEPSLTIPVKLSRKDSVDAIVLPSMKESGATPCLIHKSLLGKFDIPVTHLRRFISLDAADG